MPWPNMSASVSLSADITTFSLILGSLDSGKSPRCVVAMLALHEDVESPLELDVDVNPYAVPFHARFEPGQALLSDGSPIPGGCGALGFVAPFTSRYTEIEPVAASIYARVSLPEADFEALWSTLATGRPDRAVRGWTCQACASSRLAMEHRRRERPAHRPG